MKILIIDYSNVLHRCVNIAQKNYVEELSQMENFGVDERRMYQIYRKLFFNETMNHVKRFKPNKVVFAMDDKNYWRKEVYPKYKDGRDKVKSESPIDFDKFYPEEEKFYQDLKSSLSNFHFLRVEKCEADDIMAVLSKKYKDDEIVLMTVDKDMNQLLVNPNVKRWNPMSKEADRFVIVADPKAELHLKVIEGDKGDNIFNIAVLDEDKYPIEGKRFGLGPVMAQNILNEENFIKSDFIVDKVQKKYPNLSTDTIKEELEKNYQRNLKLIDFSFIPSEIEEKIINTYMEYPSSPLESKKLLNLAMRCGDDTFVGEWNRHKEVFESIS